MAYPSEKILPHRKALWDRAQAIVDDPKSSPQRIAKARRAQEMLAGLERHASRARNAPKLTQPSYTEMLDEAVKTAERRGAPAEESPDSAVQLGLVVMMIGETVTGILFPAARGVPTVTALIVGAVEYYRRKQQNRRRRQLINEELRVIENRWSGGV